jgi:hypothetical protein
VYQYVPNSAQNGPGVLWTQPTGSNPGFTPNSQSGNLLPPLPSHLQTPPPAPTQPQIPSTTPTEGALPSVLFYPVGSNQQAMAVPLTGPASGALTSLPPLPTQSFRFAQNGSNTQQRPVFPFAPVFTLENPPTNEIEEENHVDDSSDESSDEENV